MPRIAKSTDNTTLLVAALEGLELQKQRIDEQIRNVRRLLGHNTKPAPQVDGIKARTGKKRKLSAAARQRIAAAQKRRWAEYRKNAAKQA